MAQKLYEESNIIAIADAIREKNGTSDTYKTSEMADAIIAITTGGGGDNLPEEAFLITGNCSRRFAYNGWNWFIDNFSNKITSSNITNANQMFNSSNNIISIPLQLNFKAETIDMGYMFGGCNKLTTLPNMGTVNIKNCERLLNDCYLIREIPEDFYKNWDFSYLENLTSQYSGDMSGMFATCYSLRKVPKEMISKGNKVVSYSYAYLNAMCNGCYALDELIDLPLYFTSTWTSNIFSNSFSRCSRLKNLTFETNEDGTPKAMNWKSQTMDLSQFVGYVSGSTWITQYNSGLTRDTLITGDNSYQLLKDNPDSWASLPEYSRYNHDSAVNTINSLPDTSAYLATAGGTNTIKFKGVAGSKTDGGAINTLTPEEIAVATVKGWTVSIA